MNKIVVIAMMLGMLIAGRAHAAEPAKDAKAAGDKPEMKLPPGWTEEDMKACMLAGTPGKQHEHLAKSAGTWTGKTHMTMGPGGEVMKSECTMIMKPLMDGRYFQCEIKGDMPGMGPFLGVGTYGFDNVTQKFVATWIDNHGTGIMTGTGELSPDGKVLTWNYTFNCPITKKPAALREIQTTTGANTMTLEMHGADPKTGKEYKMMVIEYTKKP